MEAAEAPVDLEPGEAAPGAAPEAVGQVRVVVCGMLALVAAVELARDPGLGARAVRVGVEEPEQGAAQAAEAVARAAVVGEVKEAVARVPVRVVPVAAVAPARAMEERVGERERRLENGQQPPPCCAAKGLADTACPEPGKVATELKRKKCARCWGCSRN